MTFIKPFIGLLIIASSNVMADWSTSVTFVSDYTFNGISQTQNKPALQGSLDYAFDGGEYLGSWGSNVDFETDTSLEWDFYAGKFIQLNKKWSIDYGVAYYSYHTGSSDGNYPEVYSKFGYDSDYGITEFNVWYSWDYFGTSAGHVITMIAHSFDVLSGHTIRLSADTSNSLDGNKYLWDEGAKSYYHYRVSYQTNIEGFDIEISAENTNLGYDTADERVVLSISRVFSI